MTLRRRDPRGKIGMLNRAIRLPAARYLAIGFLLWVIPSAHSLAWGAAPDGTRLVVVLYPQNNGAEPDNYHVNLGIRSAIDTDSGARIEIYDEYIDVSPDKEKEEQDLQRDFLRNKYAHWKLDLVIAAFAPSLDFVLKNPDVFPGAPVVFCLVDHREPRLRDLPPHIIGTPTRFDLAKTLDLALRLHPATQTVAVVSGSSELDHAWERDARETFRLYEGRLKFVYLTGLSLQSLKQRVANLPERSIVYYLHVFRDGTGKHSAPISVLEVLAPRSNAPIYGHDESYIGRGIVGGRVTSFEREATNAALLGLRILGGEKPEHIGVQPVSENYYMFDWRQLHRWNIDEAALPLMSIVRSRELDFWDRYKWHVMGAGVVCALQMMLIAGLVVQRGNLKRAEQRFRQAIDAAPNGMLMVSADGKITLANAHMEKMFGYRTEELVGQPVEVLLPERHRDLHADYRIGFLESPESRLMGAGKELFGRRKDGSEVAVEIGLSPLYLEGQLFVLASIIETTQRREAERNLRKSEHQLRQLSGRLIGVQESERCRLARELHDDVNQRLAMLSVEMDLLRQRPPESVAELRPRLVDLSAQVRELSSSVHEISYQLHPLKLEQLGLIGAVGGLCKEVTKTHRLAVHFHSELQPDSLSPEMGLCLYRIVQESLQNTIKHSGAREASVTLRTDDDEIQLQIVDDGNGFDAATISAKGGLGFVSMRERLRLVGGQIAIDTLPSEGTRIEVRVPLVGRAHHGDPLRGRLDGVPGTH